MINNNYKLNFMKINNIIEHNNSPNDLNKQNTITLRPMWNFDDFYYNNLNNDKFFKYETQNTNVSHNNIKKSFPPLLKQKQRGRPKKIKPNECYICKSKSTSEWRTLIIFNKREYVCNACGLRERKLLKIEKKKSN